MACAALSANSCTIASTSSGRLSFCTYQKDSKLRQKQSLIRFRIRAASTDDSDCNDEECAPDKEVGKVSMEWVAGDNTKVVGTFPPRKRGWTGYVEKDTAGQTNIYSVEPAVYVAESAISSGTAGTASDGAENTAAIAAGIALISIAAASSVLLQVGKNSPPPVQTMEYSGPSLSYYINKFKPAEIVQASVIETPNAPEVVQASAAPETEAPNAPEVESSAPEAPAPQVEVQSEAPQDTSSSSSDIS
ncbi:protein MAINTENANCE OF PSII UNDER HIGH LIGHT 1 [Nicotiana tomentosiformis]|uniref:protein MAINTENANCE OF PSII UNDER HIGH LIGHT 1 n=1 Tax=Nicotiana tomentosiformis TaxID=4098 RepID=UPI00051C8098|nr:protein MAINTENANCE OF PSII UNDER HIGH LIGHT 1 isoform X1 [Nicotiana tomentosiformis]